MADSEPVDIKAIKGNLWAHTSLGHPLEKMVTPDEIIAMLNEIVSLRARITELEAERGVITYVAVNTNPHPKMLKQVLNDALRDVQRKYRENTK